MEHSFLSACCCFPWLKGSYYLYVGPRDGQDGTRTPGCSTDGAKWAFVAELHVHHWVAWQEWGEVLFPVTQSLTVYNTNVSSASEKKKNTNFNAISHFLCNKDFKKWSLLIYNIYIFQDDLNKKAQTQIMPWSHVKKSSPIIPVYFLILQYQFWHICTF